MDREVLGNPQEAQAGIRANPLHSGGPFFRNEGALRSGWRLLVYILLTLVIGFGFRLTISPFVHSLGGVTAPANILVEQMGSFTVVYCAALIMARLEKKSSRVYGLPLRAAFGKLFWQGWLLGLCEVSALVGTIALFGAYSFGNLAMHGMVIARWGLLWAMIFLFVGLAEEFSFRGYTQFTLADGIGFWPSAIILSGLFGAFHLHNRGEDLVGVASIIVTGLVWCFALQRTGSLWLVVGWHTSFDFGETFLFSVPNSGVVFDGHLSNATLHGAMWLTGGTVGPEGSIFSFMTMGIAAVLIHFAFPAKKNAALENSQGMQIS